MGGFILGEVVRRVTGTDIRTVLRDAICRPLGMRWMNYGVASQDVDRVAQLLHRPTAAATALVHVPSRARHGLPSRHRAVGGSALPCFGHIGFTNVFGWADPERDVAAALLRSGKPTIYPQILDLYDVLRQIGLACPRIRDGSRIGSDDRRSSASAA